VCAQLVNLAMAHNKYDLRKICEIRLSIGDLEKELIKVEPWDKERVRLKIDEAKLLYSEITGKPYKSIDELSMRNVLSMIAGSMLILNCGCVSPERTSFLGYRLDYAKKVYVDEKYNSRPWSEIVSPSHQEGINILSWTFP